MEQDSEITPVMFRKSRRKEPEGLAAEVTAVFPCEPADYDGRFMTCYARIGQHGSCGHTWLNTTHKAKPDEYADLLRELESLGYRLKIYSRMQPWMRKKFNAEVARLRSYIK